MKTTVTNGAWFPASSSSGSEGRARATQTVALLLAGVLVVWLHESLRIPLKLPGRHGLELMAVLVLCRSGSGLRWAATAVGLSAMVTTLAVGGAARDADAGLTAALIYGLQGFIVDLGWTRVPRAWAWGLAVGLLAGVAHATKPLLRWGLETAASGLHYGSLVQGLAWPLATHLLFGLVGGWAAMAAVRAVRGRNGV